MRSLFSPHSSLLFSRKLKKEVIPCLQWVGRSGWCSPLPISIPTGQHCKKEINSSFKGIADKGPCPGKPARRLEGDTMCRPLCQHSEWPPGSNKETFCDGEVSTVNRLGHGSMIGILNINGPFLIYPLWLDILTHGHPHSLPPHAHVLLNKLTQVPLGLHRNIT